MALSPDFVQLGVNFQSPQPFSVAQFEQWAASVRAQVRSTGASRPGGDVAPILIATSERTKVTAYDPTGGAVAVYLNDLGQLRSIGRKSILQLCRMARIRDSSIRSWEVQTIFVATTQSNATRIIQDALPNPPEWARSLLGVDLTNWGLRLIPNDASRWSKPLPELSPWVEVTVEPLVDNPSKLLVGFVVRENSWPSLNKKARELTRQADILLRRLLA